MSMDEIFDTIVNENEFKHGKIIQFLTDDYILFNIQTIHDSNFGIVCEGITYKQVFDCINHIEKNRDKFIGGIKVEIVNCRGII